jgi:hypothetical protein
METLETPLKDISFVAGGNTCFTLFFIEIETLTSTSFFDLLGLEQIASLRRRINKKDPI